MQEFYSPELIEFNVQQYWEKNNKFKVTEDKNKKKYYCLSMLPYPSGNLHMGHVRNYTIGDVISRYQRMLGKNVLHPIGWDAFGLPAEEAAIKNNISPAIWTQNNINYMKKQLKSLGFSYDWSREINTCSPEYYRWEQWFFINLYKKKLIYKKKSIVNWCSQDKTVLANEQVKNGRCWRCDTTIEFKRIPQWFIRITHYANELLNDLNKLKHWPKQVKDMQKNWIGRSEGVEIKFSLISKKERTLNIYTSRPSILMGVTYIIISINHPLLKTINKKNLKITAFIKKNYNTNTKKNKNTNIINQKGIDTNLRAVHPFTKEKLPIWITNCIDYNNGINAIMAVPGHNQFHWDFAKKYNLSIKTVINNSNNQKTDFIVKPIITNKGILCNSGEFNGLDCQAANEIIAKILIKRKIGKRQIKYKIRDWCISRQRYWGAPIPMVKIKNGSIMPVSDNKLPVILPDYLGKKNNFNSLKKNYEWIKTTYNKQCAFRETDTFDTFMESSWYYARYTCPNYNVGMIDSTAANYWLPVDQYIGGIEHATMHLIYFRFYHKLLRDSGLIVSNEPVKKLLCQGMVLSDSFYYLNDIGKKIWIKPENIKIKRNKLGKIIKVSDINNRDIKYDGMSKMSKSKKNGIDPQTIIKKYGADTLRLFIMFAAPVNMSLEWKETGIEGANRFLKRIWNIVYKHVNIGLINTPLNINLMNDQQKLLRYEIHTTIIKVTNDIDNRQSFNTAIASIMKLTNKIILAPQETEQDRALLQEALVIIILMLYPFTPHICFVLWNILNNKQGDIDKDALWPTADKNAIIKNTTSIVIQINGKLRSKIIVPVNADEKLVYKIALQEKSIVKYLKKNKIQKTIYIPKKLLNLVLIK